MTVAELVGDLPGADLSSCWRSGQSSTSRRAERARGRGTGGDAGMNDIQQHVRQQVNDAFAIASDHVREDGTVEFVCDDGDTGVIYTNGAWRWT